MQSGEKPRIQKRFSARQRPRAGRAEDGTEAVFPAPRLTPADAKLFPDREFETDTAVLGNLVVARRRSLVNERRNFNTPLASLSPYLRHW